MLNDSSALDRTFAVLSDPTRRGIVVRLASGPLSIGDLARPLPMSLPAVLQHVKVLESSGLIRSRKVGRVRTCELDPAALARAGDWIAEQRRVWEARTDRLQAYLDATKGENGNG